MKQVYLIIIELELDGHFLPLNTPEHSKSSCQNSTDYTLVNSINLLIASP